jgi:hypothetical protein
MTERREPDRMPAPDLSAPDLPAPDLPPDGPTELIPNERGELVERLSGGTATLLLVWLLGVGAGSWLLGVWFYVWLISGERLGIGALFGGPGLYTAIAGGSGPCILWLAGRAQGRSLAWFIWTSAKIGLLMVVVVAVGVVLIALISGALPGLGVLILTLIAAGFSLVISVIWAVATWAADQYVARARLRDG